MPELLKPSHSSLCDDPDSKRKRRRIDDWLGLLGGAACLELSQIDQDWELFWLLAGLLLLIWSLISLIRHRRRT